MSVMRNLMEGSKVAEPHVAVLVVGVKVLVVIMGLSTTGTAQLRVVRDVLKRAVIAAYMFKILCWPVEHTAPPQQLAPVPSRQVFSQTFAQHLAYQWSTTSWKFQDFTYC